MDFIRIVILLNQCNKARHRPVGSLCKRMMKMMEPSTQGGSGGKGMGVGEGQWEGAGSMLDELIKKTRYIYKMEYSSALKREEILSCANTWIKLEDIP